MILTEKAHCFLFSFALFLSVFLIFASCRQEQDKVERTMEDGVEVVINHLEPYSLPGEPSNLHLEEALSIDTGKNEIAQTGLITMDSFCVDSERNIYSMLRRSSENFIFKFDHFGKYITSFGRKGQGPGEFAWGGDILMDAEDHIMAKDMTKEQFFIFSREGVLLDEIKLEKNIIPVHYLGDKKYLVIWQERDPKDPVFRNYYGISNNTLSENREFYRFEFEDSARSVRYNPIQSGFVLGASDRNIFVGNAKKGYEILVFDFDGNLIRKIRKAFRPVEVPEEYKALIKKNLGRYPRGQELIKKLDFPPHMPPFRYLFTDEQGRLYVMTHEREGERKFWYDIFTREGIFISRIKLDNVQVNYFEDKRYNDTHKDVMVKKGYLYCVREKESGYMALTVYKKIWE